MGRETWVSAAVAEDFWRGKGGVPSHGEKVRTFLAQLG